MKYHTKKLSYLLLVALLTTFTTSCEKQDEYMDWKAMNDRWFENHQHDKGFEQTESGLCYRIIREGNPSDRKPNPTSYILATYEGKLIDGTIFDKGEKRNLRELYQLIKGLQEGLLMMHNGDIYEFYIPAHLGYGSKGKGSIVPPHSTMYFRIELNDSGL